MYGRITFFVAGGDIQKSNLVCAGFVIAAGDFYRVPSIANADEIDALHDATLIDVKAGNNTFCQ